MSKEGLMAEDLVTLNIDGIKVEIEKGRTVLEAAQKCGAYIPTLCYQPKLTRFGACRLCLVQIEGFRKLVTACTTPATEGMVVHTSTPEIDAMRKTVVELLLLHHPLDCLVCDRGGDCELQKLAFNLRVTDDRFGFKVEEYPVDDTNLFIQRNFKKCMLCGRCVRVCDEVRNIGALGFFQRGFSTVIGYPYNKLVNCEYCGQCLSVCPVGALISKLSAFEARPWQLERVRSVCSYCGCGCSVYIDHKRGDLVKISSKDGIGVNDGLLCVKGRFGYDYVTADKRLTTPLIKTDKGFVAVSWAEALELVAQKLNRIKEEKGAEAIAGITGARCTNEENYLFQKFMRAGLGTNNVDNYARLEHAPSIVALLHGLGMAAATNSLTELQKTEAILLAGSNITASQVIAGIYVKQAVRNRGAKLIVIDPCETEIVRFADVWLRPKPGTDLAVINGLLYIILKKKWQQKKFIKEHTLGFEEFSNSIAEFTPQRVEELSGVPAAKLEQAAQLFAQADTGSIAYGMGITQQPYGTDNVLALINLSLLTGKLGREYCGIYPLRSTCNVQGACDMGVLPDYYPGYMSVGLKAHRDIFKEAWGAKLPTKKGLYLPQMLTSAQQGKLSAMYIMGENLLLAYPDYEQVRSALEALDFLVVQDLFLTETAKLADVVLPAVSYAEKLGTFTSMERRVQQVRPAVCSPGEAKPDWKIIAAISRATGFAMNYTSPSEIMSEISELVPAYGGIDYSRLGGDGIFWPCRDELDAGKSYYTMADFAGGKVCFSAVEYHPPVKKAKYPFTLITGGVLFHHGTGTMSRSTRGLTYLCAEGCVEIHPDDAAQLKIEEGEIVEVVSVSGRIKVKARLVDRYQPGIVFIPNHFADVPVNQLIGAKLDKSSNLPASKLTMVDIQKVE
jgi:formate dehydrogenase alpha subunit